MADLVPAGSEVSAGTYQCTQCGYELTVGSTKYLPPCPECSNGDNETVRRGDSVNDRIRQRAETTGIDAKRRPSTLSASNTMHGSEIVECRYSTRSQTRGKSGLPPSSIATS